MKSNINKELLQMRLSNTDRKLWKFSLFAFFLAYASQHVVFVS